MNYRRQPICFLLTAQLTIVQKLSPILRYKLNEKNNESVRSYRFHRWPNAVIFDIIFSDFRTDEKT